MAKLEYKESFVYPVKLYDIEVVTPNRKTVFKSIKETEFGFKVICERFGLDYNERYQLDEITYYIKGTKYMLYACCPYHYTDTIPQRDDTAYYEFIEAQRRFLK